MIFTTLSPPLSLIFTIFNASCLDILIILYTGILCTKCACRGIPHIRYFISLFVHCAFCILFIACCDIFLPYMGITAILVMLQVYDCNSFHRIIGPVNAYLRPSYFCCILGCWFTLVEIKALLGICYML